MLAVIVSIYVEEAQIGVITLIALISSRSNLDVLLFSCAIVVIEQKKKEAREIINQASRSASM